MLPETPTSIEKTLLPPYLVIVIWLAAIVFFLLLASGITMAMLMSNGLGLDDLQGLLTNNNTVQNRNIFRTTLLIQHTCLFVLPAITAVYIAYKSVWTTQLGLARAPQTSNVIKGVLLILAALPLVQFTYWLNQQIPLPEWASSIEDNTQEMIMQLLETEAPYELFFNILVVAVLPAIGEELAFRGVLQKQLQRVFHNPNIAVWITAIIFSAIHVQFEGFIPRMLLGAVLGYLFVWTKNLWIPILAHFFNNAFQVVAQYLYAEEWSSLDLEQMEQEVSYPLTLLSTVAVGYLGYLIWKHNTPEVHTSA